MKIVTATYSVSLPNNAFPVPDKSIVIRNVAGQIKVAIQGEIVACFSAASITQCDATTYRQELFNLHGQIYGRAGSVADHEAMFAELRRFA
jgi:hypothetical protein